MSNVTITKFRTSRLTNAAHKQFHEEFLEKLQTSDAVKQKLSVQLANYVQSLQTEDTYYKLTEKSMFTEKIHSVCSLCSSVYSAMRATIYYKKKMAVTDEVKDAATRMIYFLDSHRISRVNKYIRRLSLFKSLADDILAQYSKDMEVLGIGDEVTSLKTLSTDMQNLISVRTAERQSIPAGALKAARREVDDCYQVIVERINAYSVLSEGENGFKDVIEYENAQIRRYMRVELNQAVSDNGEAPGTGTGDGNGTGTDSGSGDSAGTGTGEGDNAGTGSGNGSGTDTGNGDGSGSDSGNGDGTGTDSGSGGGNTSTDDDSPFHP
ncbi:MAG: DUF6261 family protein [Bacteroidales bacterium]|nr:DUF6261 family protein [Bacteroidales bacterium]